MINFLRLPRRFAFYLKLFYFSQPSPGWPNYPPPTQFQFPPQQWSPYMAGMPQSQHLPPTAFPGYPPMAMPYPYPYPGYFAGGPPLGPPLLGPGAPGVPPPLRPPLPPP